MSLVDSGIDLGDQDKLSVLRVCRSSLMTKSPQLKPPKLRNLN